MNYSFERRIKGYKSIAGLDEAGRGPLAGPVVAAAVIIRGPSRIFREVKDSKKLSEKKREELYDALMDCDQIEWGIGRVSEKVIDRINILEATKLAMKRAARKIKPDFLIIDGNFGLDLDIPQRSVIKGDEKVLSCATASIIAKVFRDRAMRRYANKYPQYGFEKHKGYPTKLHKRMLKKYGSCKIHRKSFKPVRCLNK